ncbi:MAG: polysaccharide deacetylase, partial [Roseiflexaceae bacterium]
MRRGILLVLLGGVLLGLGGAALFARERLARCAYVPLLTTDRLPVPDFVRLQTDARSGPGVPPLPAGWSAPARGVQVGGFTVTGTGHSFQLIGIANALQAPLLDVRPGERYCVAAQALADAASGTRLRVQFGWRDAQDQIVATDVGAWQEVRRWAGTSDHGGWSMIVAGFQAPAGAAQLALSFHPASDDRVYLDDIQVRRTMIGGPDMASEAQRLWPSVVGGQRSVVIQPWPEGRRAALSFSFDWETAMGGLIHSRSDDPNSSQNPL